MEEKNEVRLQKFLADNGIASRRKCEQIILDGRVKVNEKVVTKLGTKINPYKDFIEVDGKVLQRHNEKIYVLSICFSTVIFNTIQCICHAYS